MEKYQLAIMREMQTKLSVRDHHTVIRLLKTTRSDNAMSIKPAWSE